MLTSRTTNCSNAIPLRLVECRWERGDGMPAGKWLRLWFSDEQRASARLPIIVTFVDLRSAVRSNLFDEVLLQ